MDTVSAMCVAVPRKKAEEARQRLLDEGILRTDLKIRHDNKYVYLPVMDVAVGIDDLISMEFERVKRRESFRDLISEKVPAGISSFDVIGDIAVLRIPSELMEYREDIGNAMLSTNKSIKVVCVDRGVKQDYRLRDIEVIAGENRTETTHVEHGIKIKVDVAKAYYSPRLASERKRIADMVKKGDIVIDMFAGVAPFSLLIAKMAKPSRVYAIDINPVAVKYESMNAKENGVGDIVEVMEGDARDVVPSLGRADHVIMNLPHSAHEFLPVAINAGKMVHYYEIIEKSKIDERLERLESEAGKDGKKVNVKEWRVVGGYSPSRVKIGVDMVIC